VTTGKPQLHNSHLIAVSQCGERFRLSYLEGMRVRPGIAAAVGSGVHAAAARNLTRKIETGQLMPMEEVRDAARDAFALLPEELERGAAQVEGEAMDRTVQLTEAHARVLAPVIRPAHVERAWVLEAEGFPFDLAGEIDVQEPAGDSGPATIRDLKTTGKRPTERAAATSSQLSLYSLAHEALEGERPELVALDYLVPSARGVSAGTVVSRRRDADIDSFWARLERIAEVIEKQAFTPARPYDDWFCSPRWCGFARTNPETGRPYCRFFSEAPAFFAAPSLTSATPTATGGFHHGTAGTAARKRSRVVGTGSAERDAILAGL
jgi:hypothetical protein